MPTDPVERLTQSWTYEDFKTELIRAESRHPPSESSLPTTIETGAIGAEVVRLEAQTFGDSYKRESNSIKTWS